MEDMVQARDRVRAARETKEEDRQGLPPLEVGNLVVGHPPSPLSELWEGRCLQ